MVNNNNQVLAVTDEGKFKQRYGGLEEVLGEKLVLQAGNFNNGQLELDFGKGIEQL